MKKLVLPVVLLLALAGAAFAVAYRNAADTDSLPAVSVNGVRLSPVSGRYSASFVPDVLPQSVQDIFSRQVSFLADSVPPVIQADKTYCEINAPCSFNLSL